MKDSGKMLRTGFWYRFVHYMDDPDKDLKWAMDKSIEYGGMNSPRWQREMEGNWRTYMGDRVWPMLDRVLHHRKVYLDKSWALYRVIDHGVRHPTCCLWVGVNKNGDRHIYREYYMTDVPVSVNCQNILKMSGNEPIIATYIDPSTRRRENHMSSSRGDGLSRLIDIYEDNGLYCEKADNSAVGYDKVSNALMSTLAKRALYDNKISHYLSEMCLNKDQLLIMSSRPALSIDVDVCQRAYSELENLRWQTLVGDQTQKSAAEKTVDVDDEAADCVRYSFTDSIIYQEPVVRYPVNSPYYQIQQKRLKEERYHSWN